MHSVLLEQTGSQAIVIRSTDMHGLEMPHSLFMLRHALSGFYGSAGTLIVHKNGAACLWTDSRYELAAQKACFARGLDLVIQPENSWKLQIQWIAQQSKTETSKPLSIALCELQFSQSEYKYLASYTKRYGYVLKNMPHASIRTRALKVLETQNDVQGAALLANTRIISNKNAIWHISEKNVSYNALEKLHKLKAFLHKQRAHCFISANVHEIAYLTGLRATVLPHLMLCPCVFAFIYGQGLSPEHYVFIVPEALCCNSFVEKLHKYLGIPQDLIHTLAYEDLMKDPMDISHLTHMMNKNARILYDPRNMPRALVHALEDDETLRACEGVLQAVDSPLCGVKDLRSDEELDLIQECILIDCAALLEGLHELVERLHLGEMLYEKNAADILLKHKQAQHGFLEESFQTISASGPNGALPHYTITEGTGRLLKSTEPYLLDCGAHYACKQYAGTTDITRCFLFSQLLEHGKHRTVDEPRTRAYKEDYTAVLKAHIALALRVFERGTDGRTIHEAVLAVLKKQKNRSYAHGTGHGIGFCTDVHEGEESISTRAVRRGGLMPSMVFSNEPGYYVQDLWGIRLENMVCVRASEKSTLLHFETLTLFPFQQSLIIESMLTHAEATWLRDYQARCKKALGSRVSIGARTLLETLTE